MTDIEKKLASVLLEMASGRFSNHVSNCFYLAGIIPDVEERRALVKAMHEDNGDPEEYDPNANYEYFYDWWLMSYLARKILK